MTLDFETVRLDFTGPVALLRMTDAEHGNAMRPALFTAVEQALAAAVAQPPVRVVVALGLATVFCSGAPRDALRDADRGDVLADCAPFGQVFARCPVPVVSAVRGHAIGGGLITALYADLAVLSERSVYAANFLQYGLAPYLGVTHVLPLRLGSALGTEMLLTARSYRGAELRARGAALPVVAHDEVEPHAIALAQRIAQAPRRSLELVKGQLAGALLADADAAMRRELGPHRASTTLTEVKERANAAFGPPGASRYSSGLPAARVG
jgi:polyketide biosynthesis enoyl-CoA hydratase PksI